MHSQGRVGFKQLKAASKHRVEHTQMEQAETEDAEDGDETQLQLPRNTGGLLVHQKPGSTRGFVVDDQESYLKQQTTEGTAL